MYKCIRQILPHVTDFKKFWKQRGPFDFALTSADFPPILLEPEEWIFSNDKTDIIKELMQFHQRRMAFVRTRVQTASGSLTPEDIIPWQLTPFPEEWNPLDCPAFFPQGYLTRYVLKKAAALLGQETEENLESDVLENGNLIETVFFQIVGQSLSQMGYELLSPKKDPDAGSLEKYLSEWEEDEREAALLP